MRWINVKDKLPKDGQEVLFIKKRSNFIKHGVFETTEKHVFVPSFTEKTEKYVFVPSFRTFDNPYLRYKYDDVRYWTPVPDVPDEIKKEVKHEIN